MDEQCRHELPDAQTSQGPSQYTASLRHSSVEKSVRFGEDASSTRSPDRYTGFQPRPIQPGMNDDIDERDSEDPDESVMQEERKSKMTDSKYTQQQESELSESRNTPYDPVLEQRIADIKRSS